LLGGYFRIEVWFAQPAHKLFELFEEII